MKRYGYIHYTNDPSTFESPSRAIQFNNNLSHLRYIEDDQSIFNAIIEINDKSDIDLLHQAGFAFVESNLESINEQQFEIEYNSIY